MKKRKINQQQLRRIALNQHSIDTEDGKKEPAHQGRVITRYGSKALIQDENMHPFLCSIRPSIESLVAGDEVLWQKTKQEDQGVIVRVNSRNSVLGRPDKNGVIKAVAANIDQMIIVIASKPLVSWALLDSYLVIAEYLHFKPCITLNKTDLICPEIVHTMLETYKPLGYTILFTSTHEGSGLSELEKHLFDHVSVFVGQSGVGKSSLISEVLPKQSASIKKGAISQVSNLGKHTTSASTYYPLRKNAGAIIDSPGVREFGLWHMPPSEIAKGFREFAPFLSACKFRDCNHLHTPGCAILKAKSQKLISAQRYQSYLDLVKKFS